MIIISLNLKLFYLFIFKYKSKAKKEFPSYNFKIANGKIKSHMRNQASLAIFI